LELEKWSQEYNEQMEVIEKYNKELITLNKKIYRRQKRQKHIVLFILGMILAEIFILFYIR